MDFRKSVVHHSPFSIVRKGALPMVRRFGCHVAAGCMAFFVSLAPAVRAADWPQHRGGPDHNASAPALPGDVLVPLWTTRFPAVINGSNTFQPEITASAAVSNGVVYIGSRNTNLYALNARTGGVIWQYAAGSPIDSSALVRDGSVYFSTYSGLLTALNAADGSVKWQHASGGSADRASPNISGSNVISAASFPKRHIFAVPIDSTNPAPEAWRQETDQFIYSSAAVDPVTQNIYCPSDDGKIYALKPDGTALWPQPFAMIGGVYRATPAVANGKVYLSSGDYDWALHAVDAATGTLAWNADMTPKPDWPSGVYRTIQVSSPAVDGDFVSVVGGYGSSVLGGSILYAFKDLGTSAQTLWTAPLPNYVTDGWVSSPSLTPSSILVGTAGVEPAHPDYPNGRLFEVSRTNGAARWYAAGSTDNPGGQVFASPAIAGDLVVIGDKSGLVTAYQSVPGGDVDDDGLVTARDAVRLLGYAATGGQAPAHDRYRGDLLPANTVPADRARSFGNGLVTPAEADLALQRALGL
jgi:outer membrane protein assembly factor BamB